MNKVLQERSLEAGEALKFSEINGGSRAETIPASAPTVTSVRVYKVASFRGKEMVCEERVSVGTSETHLRHYGDQVEVTVEEIGYINGALHAYLDGNEMSVSDSDPISPGRGQAADRFMRSFINGDDISYGPVNRIFTYKAQDNKGHEVILDQPFIIHWAYMQE